MVLLIGIIAIIILSVLLWLGINYLMLSICKYRADKMFFTLDKYLKEEYKVIYDVLTQLNLLTLDKQKLLDDTKRFLSQALDFSIEKDGNERIIGYANAILENIKIISNLSNEIADNPSLNKLKNMQKKSEQLINDYNNSAQKLKHYVDVFPSSLMARLKRISTMDYINQ